MHAISEHGLRDMSDGPSRSDEAEISLSPGIRGSDTAARSRRAWPARLVQGHAAKFVQSNRATRHLHAEKMSAVHRCDDLRLSYSAYGRSQGAGRRIQLGL